MHASNLFQSLACCTSRAIRLSCTASAVLIKGTSPSQWLAALHKSALHGEARKQKRRCRSCWSWCTRLHRSRVLICERRSIGLLYLEKDTVFSQAGFQGARGRHKRKQLHADPCGAESVEQRPGCAHRQFWLAGRYIIVGGFPSLLYYLATQATVCVYAPVIIVLRSA